MKIFDNEFNTKGGIYKIVNRINGKCYVGSAKCFLSRWHVHSRQLKNKTHHNIKLQRSYNVHGPDAFYFEILELCVYEKDLILKLENDWISKLNSKINGYNIADASFGDTLTNHPRKQEIIDAWSKQRKGRKLSLEWRKALSESTKGRPLTKEHISKIRFANTGKTHSEESKQKMSNSHKGKILSDSHKANMRQSAKTRPKVSHKTRQRISQALKGKEKSKEHCDAISKANATWVYEVSIDGIVYDATAASKLLKCHIVTIHNRSKSDKYPNYIRKAIK